MKTVKRKCNLCGADYVPVGAHSMFCEKCKEESDLYKFDGWLPDPPQELLDYEESDERKVA